MGPPKSITAIASETNALASWAERLWRISKALGISGWISGIAFAAVVATWAAIMRFVQHLPWWIAILGALLLANLVLSFWIKLRVAWSIRGMKTLNLEEFANECCKFYEDFAAFMVGRIEAHPPTRPMDELNQMISSEQREAAARMHMAETEFQNRTKALVLARFAPRAFAITEIAKRFGIPAPENDALF